MSDEFTFGKNTRETISECVTVKNVKSQVGEPETTIASQNVTEEIPSSRTFEVEPGDKFLKYDDKVGKIAVEVTELIKVTPDDTNNPSYYEVKLVCTQLNEDETVDTDSMPIYRKERLRSFAQEALQLESFNNSSL